MAPTALLAGSLVAGCTGSRQPHGAARPASTARTGCPAFDTHLVSTESMQHTAAEARRQAPLAKGANVVDVVPVRIVDPVARKVGLPAPDVPRKMWVVRVLWHYDPPPGAIGRIGQPTPGAVVTANYVVDDATLRLAGNLDCRSTLRG